jgi:2-dehydro-3-deoxy-D-gluconate 5-dehydrogenase
MTGLFDLTGKVAVVTGGNGGIGLGMARGLAQAGAAVVVAGRNETKNAEAVRNLEGLGARAAPTVVDVRDEASCREMAAFATRRFGRIDILINNAGVNNRKAPEDYPPEEFASILDVNVNGVWRCCMACLPAMREAGAGKVINIGSVTSLFGVPFAAPYATSKGGVLQMSRALAAAWARHNIQVNCVLPGWIETDLTRRARAQVPELHDNVLRRTPAGRWGVPDDLAGVAAFLASPASDFITGAAITVDGGYMALG